MIRGYSSQAGRLVEVESPNKRLRDLIWIDLIEPSNEEEEELEHGLSIDVPTRDEMDEIEISSRLYQENGAVFMTAILPAHADGDEPEMQPVSFILNGSQLITVRYHEPRAFHTFPQRAAKVAMGGRLGKAFSSRCWKQSSTASRTSLSALAEILMMSREGSFAARVMNRARRKTFNLRSRPSGAREI